MRRKYSDCAKYWDSIFTKGTTDAPETGKLGIEALDRAIEWLAENTTSVVDFGCGNGSLLFQCAYAGTKTHIGIDLSQVAISKARERADKMQTGEFNFLAGGIEALENLEPDSADAFILSNILDNLYPKDAELLLAEMNRILKKGGKGLIKLNPFVTEEQIAEWNIKIIQDNVLDDGLILLNNTTEQWEEIIAAHFKIIKYTEIEYPKQQQINRVFLVANNKLGDKTWMFYS